MRSHTAATPFQLVLQGTQANLSSQLRGVVCILMQGCMKSGAVLSDRKYKWFEPDSWRFGDGAVCPLPLLPHTPPPPHPAFSLPSLRLDCPNGPSPHAASEIGLLPRGLPTTSRRGITFYEMQMQPSHVSGWYLSEFASEDLPNARFCSHVSCDIVN